MPAFDHRSQTSRETPSESPPHQFMQHMLDFVRANGGEVRYDVLASEHLYGSRYGYYSQRLDLASQRDEVTTPSNRNARYCHALASFVLDGFVGACRENHPVEGQSAPTMVEIGGGAGELKRAILALATEARVDLEFISVEPNANQREAQKLPGTDVRDGTVHKLPLETASVDLIFDEEVLDCLPVRLFKWDSSIAKLTEEQFVAAEGNELKPVWRKRTPNEAPIDHCELDLARRNHKGPYYSYAPGYWEYLLESARILRPGGIRISSDYGFIDPGKRFGANGDLSHSLRILRQPYQVDLTHYVDFWQLNKLAVVQRQFRNSVVAPLPSLLQPYVEKEADLIEAMFRFAFVAVR